MGKFLSPAGATPQVVDYARGYSNTTTTINAGAIVALDIFRATDGVGFVPTATGLYGGVLGVLADTVAPGGGTAATGEYTDRIVKKGLVYAQVQGTTGTISTGDKLIPAAGGVLNWSAAAAAGVSQANFTYADSTEATTGSNLRLVVVNL